MRRFHGVIIASVRSTRHQLRIGIATAMMVAATAVAQVPTDYTIEAFSDEFNGGSLDTTKWNAGIINYPSGSTWLRRNHPGNNTVAGGYLVQTTLYQDVTGDGEPEWTCSSVAARSFSQRFGYWESRIRITDFDWTDNAWWSSDIGTGHLSGMDGFEIDAPEAWSPNRYTASIYDHAVQDGSTPSSVHYAQNVSGKNFTTTFSVFGWDWGTDNTVRCFVDGTLVHTFSAAEMNGIEALVPQGPVQGTALWTTGLTPGNQVANGDTKSIDYVRIYQKPGWSGTASIKRWGDTANWGPDGVPAAGRAAVFNTSAVSGTIVLAADQPVQEIVFQGGDTGTTTIAGPGRLLLGMTPAVTATTGAVGGINLVNDTPAGVTIAADIVAQRKLQFSNFAGASITSGPTPGVDLVLAGRLSASVPGTPINVLTTAPVVVTGTIDSTIGRITKGGQGIVRLNAANAFAGGIEIRDGIVEVNADGALGAVTGGVTMRPGSAYDQPSLVFNGISYTDPVPLAICGFGSRTANYPQSSGAIDASGTSRLPGPITAFDDAGIYVQRGGHLTLSGTIDTREHAITLGAVGTLVVAGRVTGSTAGQIDKYNSGTAHLTGDNTGFLGSVQIRLGTLVVNGDAALGGGLGDVVRLAGGTLQTTADFTSAKGGSFAATSGNAINTNGRAVSFTGEFTGPGGFTKQGAGTLTLGGSNAFQGAMRIQTGTLAVAHPAALAGATLDLASGDAGVLRLAVAGTATYLVGGLQGSRDLPLAGNSISVGHSGASTSFAGRILGTGGLIKAGGGVLTLSGSNSFTGTTEVTAGILSITSTASLPGWSAPGRYVVADGATLAVSNAISEASILTIAQTGNLRDGASIGFDTSSASRVYSGDLGQLRRTFGLTKVGGQSLIIDGSNTFTGPTVVAGGTLQIGAGGVSGAIASTFIELSGSSVVAFNRSDVIAFGGTIRGTGGLVQQGTGTLVLSGSGDFSGPTRVATGTVSLGTVVALAGSTLDLAAGDTGSVRFESSQPTTYSIGGLQGARRLEVGVHTIAVGGNDADTVFSGVLVGSGGLVKTGLGRLTLGGTGSLTGVARIANGTLSLTSEAALEGATLSLDGADAGVLSLDAAGPTTYRFGGLMGSKDLAAGGTTLSVGGNGGSTSYSGVISGSGGLVKTGSGTLVLAADQLFSGPVVVQRGTLQVGTGGTTGFLNSSGIEVAAAAVLSFNRGDAVRLSASITGGGSLVKSGTGTLELAGANTFTGTARIAVGTLSLTSTAALTGATLDLATGDSGTVTFGVSGSTTYTIGGLQGSRGLAFGSNTLSVGMNGVSTVYGGVLSGSGRLSKVGGGTLALTGTNMHAGGIAIRGGAIAVTADGRLGPASGGIELDGGALQSLSGMTLSAARQVTIGPSGGMIDHTGSSNLIVAGSVVGRDSTLTVRTSSVILGAAFLDGPVSLGGLTLSGSTTGVGLRSAAVVASSIRVGDRQVLHLNGLNGTGTAAASYAGFETTLDGGTLRNRFGGNVLTRAITLTAASTVENRSGNGNSLTLAPGTLSLGSNALTVQCGPAVGEWVTIAGGAVGTAASGLALTGGGQLRLSGSNPGFAGRITIVNGEVRLDSATAVDGRVTVEFASTPTAKTLTLNGVSITIGGLNLTSDARVEVGSGMITVGSGLSQDRLLEALVRGRGTGSWNSATGITSAAVTASLNAGVVRAIGWTGLGDGALAFGYAAPGDTNIDRVVDVLDAANLMAGNSFDSGQPATWSQGDFDYDGIVDVLDVAGFLSGGLFDAGPYGASGLAPAAVSAVPEPVFSWVGVMTAVVAVGVGRRRFH